MPDRIAAVDTHVVPIYETLDITITNGLAKIILNSDDGRNSMTRTFCREFGEAGVWLSNRRDVRAVLLAAEGKFFSVGGDVAQFSSDVDAAPTTVLEGTSMLHLGLSRLLRMNAPIIGCVQGPAAGGAVSLISHCDLVYSGRSVTFSSAYARLGFTMDLGGSFGLAARVGISRAKRFYLLSETWNAEQAQQEGLIDVVAADDVVFAEALTATEKIAQGPTLAFGEIRRLMARSLSTPAETLLEDEAQALARVAGTTDGREGIIAFAERRSPNFEGR